MSEHGQPAAVDAVTQEILNAAVVAVADEMAAVQYRASFSPIIREMYDYSCGLFDPLGRMVAHSNAIPAQLGLMQFGLEASLARTGPLDEGDVVLCNDPYRGGTHTPDLEVFTPLYFNGQLVGYAGSIAHHIDVGGAMSGDSTDCTTIFQEGLRFPGVKLYQRGTPSAPLIETIRANVRVPDSTIGDLEAQVAACRRAAEQITALCTRYTPDVLAAALGRLLDGTSARMVASLREWPRASVCAEGYLDYDVFAPDQPVRIGARIEVHRDHLEIDLDGSADQVRGSINVPWSSTCAAAYFAARCFLGHEIPVNDGLTRHVHVHAREGSIVNPRFPAAVGGRHATVQRLADVLIDAMGRLLGEPTLASSHVSFATFNFQAVDPSLDEAVLMADVLGGGGGAHRDGPGENGIDTYTSNCALLPIEVAELEYPWRIERTELIEGSGGRGLHPGGCGIRRDYRLLADAAEGPYYVEQSDPRFAASGSQGGGTGRASRVRVQATDGTWSDLPSKGYARLRKGELISFESSGGGGFGHPDDLEHDDSPDRRRPRRRSPQSGRADEET